MDPNSYPLTPEEAFDNTTPSGNLSLSSSSIKAEDVLAAWKENGDAPLLVELKKQLRHGVILVVGAMNPSILAEIAAIRAKNPGCVMIELGDKVTPGEVKQALIDLRVNPPAFKEELMKIKPVPMFDNTIDVKRIRKDNLHYKKQQERLAARNFKRR